MKRTWIVGILAALVMLAGCTSREPEETDLQTTAVTTETTQAPTQTTSALVETTDATEQTLPSAPDFTVYDREGNPVKLSDFQGKPVVLNFWASWCGPCKSEMPEFQQAFETYGEEIHFIIVNLTDGQAETVDTAWSYIESCGYTFPVYYDTTGEAANTYGIYSIPTSFFIHADGTVEGYIPGAMDLETLEMAIGLIRE